MVSRCLVFTFLLLGASLARADEVVAAGDVAERGGANHALFVLTIVGGSIAGGLGIVVLVLWLVLRYEKKRAAELAAVAKQLGLTFSAERDQALLERMQAFPLFNRGHSRRMKNVMTAETELAKLTIFDYRYTTGGGNGSQTHSHTLVAMESDSLQLPQFSVRPESFVDAIGKKLGFQDINFDEHPEFSDNFVLQGKDEAAIRSFFNKEMLDLFTAHKGISVDASEGLFTYRKSARQKPEDIRDFMSEAYAFFTAFDDRFSAIERS